MIRTAAIVVFSFLVVACVSREPAGQMADQRFVEIAINPSGYDGSVVTIKGWISLRHEDKNLWATWADHEDWNTERCISLVGYDKLDADALDGKYVEVLGVLRKDASENGAIIRLASCRDVAVEVNAASAVSLVNESAQK